MKKEKRFSIEESAMPTGMPGLSSTSKYTKNELKILEFVKSVETLVESTKRLKELEARKIELDKMEQDIAKRPTAAQRAEKLRKALEINARNNNQTNT